MSLHDFMSKSPAVVQAYERGIRSSSMPLLRCRRWFFSDLATAGLANCEAAHASIIVQLGIAWARAATGLFGMSKTCESYTVSRRDLMLPRKHGLLLRGRRCLLAADMDNGKTGPAKILPIAQSPRAIGVRTQ